MATLQSEIDNLYRGTLEEFVPARNALAKATPGEEGKRIKGLVKPTVVPWAVNQVYWHARNIYDKLLKSGAALRKAQIAALGGKTADVREATAAHRAAISEAVKSATGLAQASGAQPSADALARMLEAISLSDPAEAHGRFTKPVQPAGFEALAGVAVKASPFSGLKQMPATRPAAGKVDGEELKRQERDAEAERRRHQAAIARAEARLDEARTAEVIARKAWEKARDAVTAAERALNSVG